jgi:4-hydroxybenzoate polyprenyltransferase
MFPMGPDSVLSRSFLACHCRPNMGSAIIISSWQYATMEELAITLRLLSSNASAFFGVLFCSLLARMLLAPSINQPSVLVLKVFFATLASGYSFDVCQQTMSTEEDMRNKPTRPIPAGLLSIDEAFHRWVVSWILSPLVLIAMGSLRASIYLMCFMAWTYFSYVWPQPGHWMFKNMFSTVSTFFLLRMLDALMVLHAPEAGMNLRLDVLYVLWAFATIHIQDFHDIEGDRETGRMTLPIILKPPTLCLVRRLTGALLIVSAATLALIGYHICDKWITHAFGTLQFMGACATSLRLLRLESQEESKTTYHLFYMPTGILLGMYTSLLNFAT